MMILGARRRLLRDAEKTELERSGEPDHNSAKGCEALSSDIIWITKCGVRARRRIWSLRRSSAAQRRGAAQASSRSRACSIVGRDLQKAKRRWEAASPASPSR